MKKINISTFAVALTGNKGAVSMLESIIDNFSKEFSGSQFHVFTVYPTEDRKSNKYKNVQLWNGSPVALILYLIPFSFLIWVLRKVHIHLPNALLGKSVRALVDSDLVLEVGGTTFTDAQPLKVIYNVTCMLPPVLLNKKIMMYSQTVGPFNSAFNRFLARCILPQVSIAVGRGRQSASNLKGLGLKNVEYCADGAFTMNYHEDVEEKIKSIYKPLLGGDKRLVGITPNSIVERKCRKRNIDHSRILGEFINYLQDKDYKVILIPHSVRKNLLIKRHNNDLYTIHDILRHVRKSDDLVVVKEDHNSEELRFLIKQLDFLIASRFHSMISAIAVSVPVVVAGWGYQKYVEVLDELELGGYAFDATELSTERLVSEFERMVANESHIKKKISDNLPKVIKSSKRNLLLAKTLIDLE